MKFTVQELLQKLDPDVVVVIRTHDTKKYLGRSTVKNMLRDEETNARLIVRDFRFSFSKLTIFI